MMRPHAFTGLQLVPPGVVLVSEGRPDAAESRPTPVEVSFYGVVLPSRHLPDGTICGNRGAVTC
jgi:hypothetical protein